MKEKKKKKRHAKETTLQNSHTNRRLSFAFLSLF